MTATISHPPTTEAEDRFSPAPPRLSLAPVGSAPALLDGAWWPRSRDLAAELPALAAVLDPLWGRITRVTVNPTQWPVVPRKVPVAGHVVNVGWFLEEQDPHELLLLSYHLGRWNLLVVPPQSTPESAAWLMAAASDPRGVLGASRLLEEAAARLRTLRDADRAVEAVWDSEGGHAARDPAAIRPVPTGR
ncbi:MULTISPECIES: DUF5994 family protein [Streptomyces]|uniref:DUF3457 domain-containing protein n=1 Tax=Streptomyces koelreuteriae TaxID=2838015 RepID=A0ABX8FT15_9ACTN|nr:MULTISPECIES: DUF5994 family protein [Streptomyces]QWB24262.1 hypothetical protein KJK29_17595 [Streptomyces koelreuteriae]UUA07261.1 DUF5994 family protein [Streptomyces koelreuteriae]UUA14890.1 DUF5994 family protein [Streptomyces sp. CRCS-T-1]